MNILRENFDHIRFVDADAAIATPFAEAVNCFAVSRPLDEPLDALAADMFRHYKSLGKVWPNSIRKKIYQSEFGDIRMALGHMAQKQLDRIESDVELLKEHGVEGACLYLIWGKTEEDSLNAYPHHDTAPDREDLGVIRHILCDYNQQALSTTVFRNEDVHYHDAMFGSFSGTAIVRARSQESMDVLYIVAEDAEALQFPIGTLRAFAYGRERKENAHPFVKPHVHQLTPVAEDLLIPRLQLDAQL